MTAAKREILRSPFRFELNRDVCIGIMGLILLAGCGRGGAPQAEVVRPVKTMLVVAGGEPLTRSFPGRVEASKKVELAFQVPGVLTNLPVRAGQTVAKGDVIAELRQDEFKARLKALTGQLDQARAALRALQSGERPEQVLRLEAQVRGAEAKLANARTSYLRDRDLSKKGAIARAEFELSETNYRIAQEELEAARQALEKGRFGRQEDVEAREAEVRGLEGRVVEANIQLADTVLKAPYAGEIAERFVEQGQNVRANEPIVKFQNVDEIEVVVDVPERVMAADLRTADIMQLVAEFSGAPGVQFPVHIEEIPQRADPVTQTFPVRVAMQTPQGVSLLPGMTATVSATYRRANILGSRILVPVAAVMKDSQAGQVAWVIAADGTVSRRPVKLGAASGDRIEVIDGLKPGDRIAVAGVTMLREGMKVRDLGDALGGGA